MTPTGHDDQVPAFDVAANITRIAACDLCGAPSHRSHVLAAGIHQLLGAPCTLTTVLCRRCRLIYQAEQYSPRLLAALYRHDTSFAVSGSPDLEQSARRNLAERQQVISQAIAAHGIARGSIILDIGGGVGDCCAHLVDRHSVWLADATEAPPVDPRIRKVDGLFTDQLPSESVDVVVMNHVLEHVFAPSELLASAARVLRRGGIAVVEVPFEIYTPLLARHLGDWRHVVYFTRSTLRAFLENAGFRVHRVALETGRYGVRRLPVIRAVAERHGPPRERGSQTSLFSIARDVVAPAAVLSLAARVFHQA